MGRFSGIASAKAQTRYPYFPPDVRLRLRILECKYQPSSNKNTNFCIVEFEVLESSNTDAVPVGAKHVWIQDACKPHVGERAVKEFIAAAIDADPNAPELASEEVYEEVFDKQALAGKEIRCVTDTIITRAKTNFTRHIFGPV